MAANDWADCLLNPIGCAADKTGSEVADSAWQSFLEWIARGLSDFSVLVFNLFSKSTTPSFDQQWWRENFNLMVAVSLPILVGLFVVQCLSGVVRREPGFLGRAVTGAFVGTAGVPIAIAFVTSAGRATDEIAGAILGTSATADGYKRMTDIGAVLGVGTAGGFVLFAVVLGLVALFALYLVMLLREVALLAFVLFAPIALVGWTWTATRHWLRRWVEIVSALLFSKIAMAAVFTLGVSATGASEGGTATIGTFLAGILLVAMAALTPMATFSFIHWVGDQGHAAARSMNQGTKGVSEARDKVDQARRWRAEHLGAKQDTGPDVVGDKKARSDPEATSANTPDDQNPKAGTPDAAQATTRPSEDGTTRHDPKSAGDGAASSDRSPQISVNASANASANSSATGTSRHRTTQPAPAGHPSGQGDVPGPAHTRES